jgi:TRAP-type uncharacterized transport system substrate-binding protein
MRGRQLLLAVAAAAASVTAVAVVMPFLAPVLSYRINDRVAEWWSGRGNRPYRIALGVTSGSYYRVGTVLNRYLQEKSGYELELVATAGVPENVRALADPEQRIDLATIESSSDDATRVAGIRGLATLGEQYFFVIAPAANVAADLRDLSGPINTGVREEGQAPTLGERVLEYYGLLTPPGPGQPARSTVVRPRGGGIRAEFEAGYMTAATRTQFLHADLVDGVLATGQYRLVPIRDHQALASALPGTTAGFIPAGAFGPERRIPPDPVPTLAVATLLVARSDLPARVASDILDVVYDPRFSRDIQQTITEERGRKVGDLPLHPAADYFYSRKEQVTSERLGRVSFVASAIAAIFGLAQFFGRMRERDARRTRQQRLEQRVLTLSALRRQIAEADVTVAHELLARADDELEAAEGEAARGTLDANGMDSVRSLHRMCLHAGRQASAR